MRVGSSPERAYVLSCALRGADDDADTTGGRHNLIRNRPLRLPEPTTALAREQMDAHPDADPDSWLFPGRGPGKPLDPQYLKRRLHLLGVSTSELQNTARFRLAGMVPAKVLADMLDFSVATFENYARLVVGPRGDYPALRLASRGPDSQ